MVGKHNSEALFLITYVIVWHQDFKKIIQASQYLFILGHSEQKLAKVPVLA